MKTYLATTNPGKRRELKALFAKSAVQIVTPRKIVELEVVESATTYAGNALLKAEALAAALRERHVAAAVLADDSGLEVVALDGRPGIYSARYGGPEMDWPERRAALLHELRGVPPYRRAARFVCALALVEPHGKPIVATGEVQGYVLEAERGTGGFGYDAVFLYPRLGRSFAALSEKEKNAVSHRYNAAQALLTILRERGAQAGLL
ncbi:RdgB/HAM1 family non-canonical purine NTP pyrophosphatase [Trebonia sp.]|uniref:RdgB/HAM1 family non-canonical purine NTP pyrophosphatase n=1 Tax=Trebonia sp. TaxID=2767075 RepID=UPI0026246318|nr:RdgB/HAM1 family non-canonical purine NTP pyrophosphatase [Trebonia sp.]